MEAYFKLGTFYLSSGVEAIAALVIAAAVLRAALATVLVAVRRPPEAEGLERVRLQLGRGLSLALEFEVAADILRTSVAPTWTQIGQLAAIVVLRTALNYFLQQEIKRSSVEVPG
jgi:uncharacterized membrane protein